MNFDFWKHMMFKSFHQNQIKMIQVHPLEQFFGIGISFYPYIVPSSLTIVEAAAPDSSLKFALVGTLVLLPMILSYTIYTYWVFRGKIDPEEGYH